jgi:hypothetical protein
LSLYVNLKPVKITYRPSDIEKLNNFFHVENIKDETKFKAREKIDNLKQSITNHQRDLLLQACKKMNKLRFDIECPVLELPFSNNPQNEQDCRANEKWTLVMGNLVVANYQDEEPKFVKAFGAQEP